MHMPHFYTDVSFYNICIHERNQNFVWTMTKSTVLAQEWLMGVIISLWIFSWSLGCLTGFCCSSSTAALQYATEEEGVVRLAFSGPETLEGQGGASLPSKGWGGLHPPVCGVWGQVGRGKHTGKGPACETAYGDAAFLNLIFDSTLLRCFTTRTTALDS